MRTVFRLLGLTIAATAAGSVSGQEPRFLYPPPAAGSVSVSRDVQYGTAAGASLLMDVYKPAGKSGTPHPALIFFNTASGPQRSNAFSSGWAQAAASNGIVGIVPDLRQGSQSQDFALLVAHLTARAADHGLDREAIAVYAGSGNVFTALPLVEDPAQVAIKAAVMYYGSAPVKQFRLDLPILYVRAGLDRPALNRGIGELVSLAVAQNAPITVLNHPTGYHAFEIFNDDEATREIIGRTLEFVKHATAAPYQAALHRSTTEATAAGHVIAERYGPAAALYAKLVAERPDDARLRLAYGEALLGDARYGAACAELEKLKGKGLGPRDLGLPAARACMLKGDHEAAIAWLRTIPARFLPADVQTDPAFAPVADRADFRALFQPR